jgi:ABC-type multidrug transport system fused ATPase/permease subunit
MKEDHKPDYANFQFLKDLWYFLKFRKWGLIYFTFILVFAFSTSLISTLFIAKIIDFFVGGGTDIFLFYRYLGYIVGLTIGGTLLRHYGKHNMTLLGADIQKNAKVEAFDKILQGDLAWHEGGSTGAKMESVNEGVNRIGGFVGFWRRRGIDIIVKIIGVLGVFALINLKYAFIAIIYMFVHLFIEFKLNKKVVERTKELRKAIELSSGKAYEFSANIGTVKALGIEKSSGKQISDREEAVLRGKYLKRKATTTKWLAIQIVAGLFLGLFLFLVGRDIFIGVLTVGAIVIYVNYVDKFTTALRSISEEIDRLINIKYGLYRMMKIFHMFPEIDESGARSLRKWRSINIKDLSFKYKEKNVLNKFNMKISKGEKIGIVGLSGSGKSTLFKLLLKLHLAKKGDIYFDKKSISEIKRNSILKKISVVPQETELFNLTLRENITISGEKFDLAKYKQALQISQVSNYINRLKDKDLTFVGERGVRLSGGEKQRLGIARALYKDSDILIFDESTSNLDYLNEGKILNAINRKLKDKTLVVAAHRLTTLKSMDRILFIERGKVVEEGSYEELLLKKGKFYKLWEGQKRK